MARRELPIALDTTNQAQIEAATVWESSSRQRPGGPIRSRTPEGVRQELWAYLAVHHAIRQFAHTAALARPAVDTDRVS
ncbi:hypothetical protein [Streptomyces sp. NBC_00872]|uniref:hypothetical protein n=1 Tax=Streptomyces sp. NBC_00872 TaxID=2903686 RepID=UPI00386B5B5E|nr:hypothetical protein OG214_07455 [Streptomyces sp. NBC_00872]